MKEEKIKEIYQTLESGGIVLLKFDVGYALTCMTPQALKKIIKIKKRDLARKCVILGTPNILKEITTSKFHHAIHTLTYPLGLVAKIKKESPLTPLIPRFILTKDTVAVFINMGQLANALTEYAFKKGKLVFGSSGNISNQGNHYTLSDVEQEIRSQVDLEINDGTSKYQELRLDGKGKSSTMLDLNKGTIIRKGLLYPKILEQAKKIGLRLYG